MALKRAFYWMALLLFALPSPFPVGAQVREDCGVVDAIDYPIDSISIEHDDFGMYRAGFNGRHTGIDMAFGRRGEPIRAAARGRITFSDPVGWDTEKGVVIIEHIFPDRSTFFTLYGHMEELNGNTFPPVGRCVQKGEVIGAVGNPLQSAPHLHYEIRRMRASTGGPGYWSVDPLEGGWMHPIEFTEQWRLRFSQAFRGIITASSAPTSPPVWEADGGAIFAGDYQIERRMANGETAWKLSVRGLLGIVGLPSGRVLGRMADNQIIVVEAGRFVAAWQPDRRLRSAPMRIGDSLVFVSEDNRIVSYDENGALRWQTEPLGGYISRYVQSGDLLAVASDQDNAFRLWVVNPTGQIVYQGTAPVPVVPLARPGGGFTVMVATQVSTIQASADSPDLILRPLLDTGQPLGRNGTAAIDPAGNVFVYPGQGQFIYAYAPDGTLRWRTRLPALQIQPLLLSVGSGCLVYVLDADGALLAYRASDGALRGIATLYAGGRNRHTAARFINVLQGEQVQFSAGYLSIATVDGPTLANMSECS